MSSRNARTPLSSWSDRRVFVFIGLSLAFVFASIILIVAGAKLAPGLHGRVGDDWEAAASGEAGGLPPIQFRGDRAAALRPSKNAVPRADLHPRVRKMLAGVNETPASSALSLDRVNDDHIREGWSMSQQRSNTERSVVVAELEADLEKHFGALAQAAAAKGPAKEISALTGLPWRTVEDRAARPRAGLAVTLLLLARWDRALGDEIKRFIDASPPGVHRPWPNRVSRKTN